MSKDLGTSTFRLIPIFFMDIRCNMMKRIILETSQQISQFSIDLENKVPIDIVLALAC